ncbi:uncharacterized protein LOC128987783 [Macrosteles quadrilineatus]|uniref:uncharacterized protein LOC128987783 n=1 Tax=Macrosteles quadrilineatus TaxID=74068 RepID=UPI0023E0EE1E|nr:uncharacterized protein LOC128987783 [Macrosteles quadrilineatus]XP_054264777.1 uncharacterized protein LOC128987783 [Macrosteles quadrilineatus]
MSLHPSTRRVILPSLILVLVMVLTLLYFDQKKGPLSTNLEDYTPLPRYKRVTEWSKISIHDVLSAAIADFHNIWYCQRAVVFLARGVLLGHTLTDCDSIEPSMGLVMVDDTLHYYGSAMVKQGPLKNTFVTAERVPQEQTCKMTYYILTDGHRPTIKDKSEPEVAQANTDHECYSLVHFKMPTMMLLSTNGTTGEFIPGKFWVTINPWEPIGVVARSFSHGQRCYRLLVITSHGRSVQAVKVSCGPVENLVITRDSLYYSDAIWVRKTQADTFVFTYNLKRSGECIKKTVILENKDGPSGVPNESEETLGQQDDECLSLVGGRVPKATIGHRTVTELVGRLKTNNTHDFDPFGGLKKYKPFSNWSYFNLQVDLGVAVRAYENLDDYSIHTLVVLIARGIPLSADLLPFTPIERLVMREDVLYFNTSIMLRREKDDTYTTLVKLDDENCFKKVFVVKLENKRYLKQELPVLGGSVSKDTHEDCMDLTEGRKLKSADFVGYKNETDQIGIPNNLPMEVNIRSGY